MFTKTMWNIAVTLFSMVGTLSSNIIVARCLNANDFGVYALLISAVSTTSTLAGVWLGPLATRNVSEALEFSAAKLPSIIKVLILYSTSISLIVVFVVWLNAGWFSMQIIQVPNMVVEIKIASLIVLLSTTEFLLMGVIAGFESYRLTFLIVTLKVLVSLPLSYLLTTKIGVCGALISQLICCSMSSGIGLWVIWKSLKNSTNCLESTASPKFVIEMMQQMLPNFLGCIVSAPIQFVLLKQLSLQPNGFEQVGAISAALMWKNSILIVPRRLSATLLPYLSRRKSNKWELVEASRSIAMLATVPIAVTVTCFSQKIMSFIGGKIEMYSIFIAGVALLAVLSSIGTGVSALIMAESMGRFGLFTNIVSSCVTLLVGFTLMPAASGMAVIVAFNVSAILNLVLTYSILKKDYASISIRQILNSIVVATCGVVLAYKIGSESLIYVVCLNIFMIFSVYKFCVPKGVDIQSLRTLLKRG